MVRRRIIVLSTLVLLPIAWLVFAWIGRGDSGPIQFRRYEGKIGMIDADVRGVEQAFLRVFPVGTRTAAIQEYFEGIGGRCFELPLDRPGQLICTYVYPECWYLPLALHPLLSAWAVNVWFEGDPRVSTRLRITAGTDGL